ncbi:MAG: hypothetical protein SPJ83_06505 [Helicobacter sp.]|nr:hypothetical protein [Helicobacter sp.]MDY5822422.1 hypothetical protein [Helicobacter sp.]
MLEKMCVLGLCNIKKHVVILKYPSDIVELWSGFYDKNDTKIYESDTCIA